MVYVECTSVIGRPCEDPLAVVDFNFILVEWFKSDWKSIENMFMSTRTGHLICNALSMFPLFLENLKSIS